MGNVNQPGRGPVDLGGVMKGWPVLFHDVHSENVALSADRRRARRVESFCKGICFSNRPLQINERLYVRFAEVSTSWSGVLRFGYTSIDPAQQLAADLPRYACPDLTNRPGFWAKALPERYAEYGTVLFFYITRSSDVMFGINGEEKGVFFSGVPTNCPLWAVVDIYGNTTSMEFVDGHQQNNLVQGPNTVPLQFVTAGGVTSHMDLAQGVGSLTLAQQQALTSQHQALTSQQQHSASLPALPQTSPTHAPGAQSPASQGLVTVRHHAAVTFTPLCFHAVCGRNVRLSTDRTVAVRKTDEYCNGYVFTQRPLACGEKLVIQVLSVDRAYVGGLAFGVTAADPVTLDPEHLPDDSDLLLDRSEYWIVNKDVCSSAEVGDELSFYLTEEGEVKYGKNGHHMATLMFIDKTLPMWAFFDVYGNTQKLKVLGVYDPSSTAPRSNAAAAAVLQNAQNQSGLAAQNAQNAGLMVSLPPRTSPVTTATVTPPPRPPPPRGATSSPRMNSPTLSRASTAHARRESAPVLPPKHYPNRPLPQPPQDPFETPVSAAPFVGQPPLVPTPAPAPSQPPALPPEPPAPAQTPPSQPPPAHPPPALPPLEPSPPIIPLASKPAPPPRTSLSSTNPFSDNFTPLGQSQSPTQNNTNQSPPARQPQQKPAQSPPAERTEEADNAENECKICLEADVNCVVYRCGHACMCYTCAVGVKASSTPLCPICRQDIEDIIKIFRS